MLVGGLARSTVIQDKAVTKECCRDCHFYKNLSKPTSFITTRNWDFFAGTKPLVTRSVKAPVTKPQGASATLQKLPLCDKCGNGIV